MKDEPEALQTDFQAAAPGAAMIPPPKIMVSLPLDADVLAWFQSESEPNNWQRRIGELLRFHMDTILRMEADYAAEDEYAARAGQEMAGPEPA